MNYDFQEKQLLLGYQNGKIDLRRFDHDDTVGYNDYNPGYRLVNGVYFVNFYYNFNNSLLLIASQERVFQLDFNNYLVINDGILITEGFKNDANNLITNFHFDININYLVIFH